ncbi:MAG: response regulator [Gemmatimonadaceae bacterium]
MSDRLPMHVLHPDRAAPALRPILLVEDNLRDAELLLEALDEPEITARLRHVRDGVEALAYLRGDQGTAGPPTPLPALIVLDLKMPRLNGLDLLAVLKRTPAWQVIPVVLMTSSVQAQDISTAYTLGVNAYVRKPLDFGEFVETVRQLFAFWVGRNLMPEPHGP